MGQDKYTAELKCPKCGRAGVAHLSEADNATWIRNKSARIDSLPEGFKQIRDTSGAGGIDIYCAECDVSAWK